MNYRKVISAILRTAFLIILSISVIAHFIPIDKLTPKIIEYNSFINTVLTLVLVVITGIYAMLTYKILLQSTAGIRSQIKPSIFVKLDRPEIKSESGINHLYLNKNIITNYGKGVAINVNITYISPCRLDKKTNQIEDSSTRHPDEPISLLANESFEDSLRTQIPSEVKSINIRFLGIIIRYEDSDRNLHQLNQSYQLNTDYNKGGTYCYLFLTDERLTILAHSDRKYTTDITQGISGSEQDKTETIFNRKYY